mmetsp:Transcript_86381/g.241610  ORF Transcript_86381/g.241610 Transcript_86381/m.241610 type:complete len:271 (+) Transcript_86381:1919-2731(+)
MPLAVHLEGLVQVLAAAVLKRRVEIPLHHHQIQVVVHLLEMRLVRVHVVDDMDDATDDESPNEPCDEHGHGRQPDLRLGDGVDIAESNARQCHGAEVHGQVVCVQRRVGEVINFLNVVIVAQPRRPVRQAIRADEPPEASQPMEDHEREPHARGDVGEGVRKADARVPAVHELDDTDEAEHPHEPENAHHAKGEETLREAVPRDDGQHVSPEPSGLEAVREGHGHVELRDLNRGALVNVAGQRVADGVSHVESENNVECEDQVDAPAQHG